MTGSMPAGAAKEEVRGPAPDHRYCPEPARSQKKSGLPGATCKCTEWTRGKERPRGSRSRGQVRQTHPTLRDSGPGNRGLHILEPHCRRFRKNPHLLPFANADGHFRLCPVSLVLLKTLCTPCFSNTNKNLLIP